MATFALDELIKNPSIDVFDQCRKADFNVFVLPPSRPESPFAHSPGEEPKSPVGVGISDRKEKPPATLLRFEAFTPSSSGSMVDARLKVRLARLHMEAQERTQRLAHELALRKLEIEAETVKLKQMELQSAAVRATSIASPGTHTHHETCSVTSFS